MRDDSVPAIAPEEAPCRVAIDASSVPLRAWTDVTVASIEPVADKKLQRFRVRLEAPAGVVTLDLGLGARMAPPVAVGERARARAFSIPTESGRQAVVAVAVGGQTRLFEGPLDEALQLADFTFTRADTSVDPSTGATRVRVDLRRADRCARLGGTEGFRVLETPEGRWLVSGGHAEGRYGYSVFGLCRLLSDGAPRPSRDLPPDDRSAAIERIDGGIAVRLAAAAPAGCDVGLARRVSAVEVPDASAPTTWRVMLEATGWRAALGLAKALPLVVTLPRGFALPLAVGDEVMLRALQAVAGIHPRRCVELRVAGRAVLVDGDDEFLRGLAGVEVSKGPCTDLGESRNGMAPRQAGMVRVEVAGVAGYSDDAQRPRGLDTPDGRVLFAGVWSGFGAGPLPPGASPQVRLTFARLR